MIGQIIGNIYQISEKLGEGGMGSVYKGIDLNLQRPVAIKVLRADFSNNPALVERFHSEAITLAKLNHPNIATLFSFIPQDGQFFMIMEFVNGETLENIIHHRGAIPYQETIMLFCQALEGIGQAHRMGIIHRDIKPANLMVMEEGFQEKKVKVMDFGIARILGTNRLTRPGGMVGTLHYMSPEQARALETDNRSDIYSLGIVLYEMLTGKIPFDANSEYDLIDLHIKQAPTPPRTFNPTIPQEVENAVLKAMAKQPSDRFQTVVEFRSFLLNQIGISSNIQIAPLIKETRVENAVNAVNAVNSPPNIPLTKVETNPNLGIIPGTRVETNPGIRNNIPATNPEIKAIASESYLQNSASDQRQTPIPATIAVPIPKQLPLVEDSFLKQHGVKLFASLVVLLVVVSGVSIGILLTKDSTTSLPTPTPVNSPTPINSPTPTPTLTPTTETHLPELPLPTPTQTPTQTPEVSSGGFPGGNSIETSKPTPIKTMPIKPIIRPTPIFKPTPKPLSPIEKQLRRAELDVKLKNLILETGRTTDPEQIKRITREKDQIKQELDKLK